MSKKLRKARRKVEMAKKQAKVIDMARKEHRQRIKERQSRRRCRFHYSEEEGYCERILLGDPDKSKKSIKYIDDDKLTSICLFPSKASVRGYCYYHQKVVDGRFDHLYKYKVGTHRR